MSFLWIFRCNQCVPLPPLPLRLHFFFDRFEIVAPVRFGLVCFRLKATDAANEELRQEKKPLFWWFI